MKVIVWYMKEGRIVIICGLGIFYLVLSSEGCEIFEECIFNKVRLICICFWVDIVFIYDVKYCEFESM